MLTTLRFQSVMNTMFYQTSVGIQRRSWWYVVIVVGIQTASLVEGVNYKGIPVTCYTDSVTHWIPFEKDYFTLDNATLCDIPCLRGCTCILGNNSATNQCDGDFVEEIELIFPPTVTTLFLADCDLDGVDRFAFTEMGYSLKELYLNNNSIVDLHPGVFDGLGRLTHLYLFNNAIRYLLPGVFAELEALRELYLVSNDIEEVYPNTFHGVPLLKVLHLRSNAMQTIPIEVFRQVTRVEKLNLRANDLRELQPGVFHGLNKLKSLEADYNEIARLSSGLFDGLVNVEEIDLDYNQLTPFHSVCFKDS